MHAPYVLSSAHTHSAINSYLFSTKLYLRRMARITSTTNRRFLLGLLLLATSSSMTTMAALRGSEAPSLNTVGRHLAIDVLPVSSPDEKKDKAAQQQQQQSGSVFGSSVSMCVRGKGSYIYVCISRLIFLLFFLLPSSFFCSLSHSNNSSSNNKVCRD